MNRNLNLIAAVAVLAGCSSMTHQPAETLNATAATFDYVIPETSAKVGVDVTITDCSPAAAANGQQFAELKVEVTPTVAAVPSKQHFTIVGGDLSGWWTSHDLSITKFDNGSIKTVNSTDSNRVLPVITNVLKGVISLVALAGSGNRNGLECTGAVRDALSALTNLKARVAEAQRQLPTAKPAQAAQLAAAIGAYTSEIGRLTTTAPLHFQLSPKSVAFDHEAGYLTWNGKEIPDTSLVAGSLQPNAFRLLYCVDPQTEADPTATCSVDDADRKAKQAIAEPGAPASCGDDAKCTRTIVMREPKRGMLAIVLEGQAYGATQGKIAKSITLPVSQWGDFTLLSTSVGLAQTRTMSVALDEYGAKTSFSWKSDARAESISGGVSSALDSATTLVSKLQDPSLQAKQNEVNELQTQQKLNQLRACKAIIEAGGFSCPSN